MSGKVRTQAENAAWTVLRRRGYSCPKACDEMERRGFPARSASSWGNWEQTHGFGLAQHGDARRYVVRLFGRPLCWGSPSWCARLLGVSPGTLVAYQRDSHSRFGVSVVRAMRAPCELMDGCFADEGTTMCIVDELNRRKASESARKGNAMRKGAD